MSYYRDELDHPRIVRMRIWNAGKREVKDKDYEVPLTVAIDGPVIKDTFMTGASTDWLLEHTILMLTPDKKVTTLVAEALHKGQFVELQVLVDGKGELEVTVDAQIADQTGQVKYIRTDPSSGEAQTVGYYLRGFLVQLAESITRAATMSIMSSPAGMTLGRGGRAR